MGGVDLSSRWDSGAHSRFVPARVGGVDLSIGIPPYMYLCRVPARVGGVDLSYKNMNHTHPARSPRPCGRGGFKRRSPGGELISGVPARVGGVDLSIGYNTLPDALAWSPPVWAGWI